MVFQLSDDLVFPPAYLADPEGLLAVGGDLSPERLMLAYSRGIFPWFSGNRIMWWSPDPRYVIFPAQIRISRSMKQVLNRNIFSITYDTAFPEIIQSCRKPRPNQDGTWITDSMVQAYTALHHAGLAHSVEAWQNGKLAGGLYGVSLGGMFYGESMFTEISNASKACLITLCLRLRDLEFDCVDCQFHTEHLESMGGTTLSREAFLNLLHRSLGKETLCGKWTENR